MNTALPAADYYGRPRPEMAHRVPASARTVLDIGCGAGAFGAGLKQEWQRQGRELAVWGLELDPAAGARAAEVLDTVLIGDAAALLAGLPPAGFDTVIMNDILEHLVDPAALLAKVRPLLGPDGQILCSLPNVRHFPNVVNLAVHGRWEYTDEGILDRTHLRFFTRSSMIALLTDAGFEVLSVEGINPTGSLKFKLVNLLTLGRWADMRYLQFALRARAAGEST